MYRKIQIIKRKSPRKQFWDYTSNACYFITINTELGIKFFGEVVVEGKGEPAILNAKMNYSDLGNFAGKCWNEIPDHYPNITLDEFQIMPNHLHGIIFFSNPDHKGWKTNEFGPPKKNHLGNVIRGFKSAVTTFSKLNDIPFIWQSRYHDVIIKENEDLERIRKYIRENPMRYAEKKFGVGK